MGKPKAPEAPDPQETAAAQTGTNVATAIANATLNQYDSFGPDGSTTYQQTGTTSFTDPVSGQTYQIPRYSITETLSDGQQQIYDQNQAADQNLSGIAQDQSAFLRDYLAEPISFDGLSERGQLNDNSGQIQTGYDQQQLQSVQSGGPDFNAVSGNAGLRQVGRNQPRLQNGYQASGIVDNTQFGQQNGNANLQRNAGFQPNYQNGYDTTGLQGFDGQTPELQRQGGTANLNTDLATTNLQGFSGDVPQYQNSYVDDFSADRARVEDALNANLDRQHARDEESLNARLADQGIQLGSEAYTRAYEDFQNSKDRSRIDATLSAGQEQSRLAALSQQQAAFGNQAQSQSFNDALTAQSFNNSVAGQQFGQNTTAAQFENQARQQDYDNSQGIVRENNQFAQQDFGNALQAQDFNNQAAQGNNAINAQLAQFGNAAQGQQFSDALSAAQFGNQAGQQQYQNAFQNTAFNNDLQQQNFQNAQQVAGFNNQLSADQASFGNAANQQAFQNQNQTDLQNNQIRQDAFNNANAATAQNNQYQQQSYDNYVNQIGANNAAAQQNNANNASQAGFNNQALGQVFGQGLTDANFQNEIRERELQELLTQRNQPLNEISALLSGSQVSRPQQFQGPQANIATTDYAGLVQNNFNNQVQQYQIEQQQQNQLLGGIFGVGSTLLASDRRLKKDLKPIAKMKNGLTVYLFKYIGEKIERVGLMAQEVAKLRPEAIVHMDNGFMAVDYAKAVR